CCGLRRNVVQCLDDFGIPLLLGHTVTEIRGGRRVEGVVLSRVDERFNPIAGSEREVGCDTLLLSVGLIPENELSRKAGVALDELTGGPVVNELFETSVSGVFACGNVLHVHDVADQASLEAYEAGRNAARRAKTSAHDAERIPIYSGEGVQYVLPQRIDAGKDSNLMFRVLRLGKKTRVIALDGKRLIKEKIIDYVNPAEMETFQVSRKELEGAKRIELSVEHG
ncbi:MAG: FAD-dependent oxidoreductase, partial [Methanobacteriota archaeon]